MLSNFSYSQTENKQPIIKWYFTRKME